MPITPKNWQDDPSTATPLSAAALEDMESRLGGYTDTRVDALLPTDALNAQVPRWDSTTSDWIAGTVSRGPLIATRTTDFTPTSYTAFSAVDVPSMQVQFTAEAGQWYEIVVSCTLLKNSVSGAISAIQAVSDEGATVYAIDYRTAPSANGGLAANGFGVYSPTAGLRTVRMQILSFSGVPTLSGRSCLVVR